MFNQFVFSVCVLAAHSLEAACARSEVCRRLTVFSLEGTTGVLERKTLDLAAHFRHRENWQKRLLTADRGVQDEVSAVDAPSFYFDGKTCIAVLRELEAVYSQIPQPTPQENN